MTKEDFLKNIPDFIVHKTWGYAELEIMEDTATTKSVCYRHKNNTSSFGTYASTWSELHHQLHAALLKQGYIDNQ